MDALKSHQLDVGIPALSPGPIRLQAQLTQSDTERLRRHWRATHLARPLTERGIHGVRSHRVMVTLTNTSSQKIPSLTASDLPDHTVPDARLSTRHVRHVMATIRTQQLFNLTHGDESITSCVTIMTRRHKSRVMPNHDATQTTFTQVMTHMTRQTNKTKNNTMTRMTRTPLFDPTRAHTCACEHTNPAKRVTRHRKPKTMTTKPTPTWLKQHLIDTGVWRADGCRKKAAIRTHTCGLAVLYGIDTATTRPAIADPHPLTPLGEALALIQNRQTWNYWHAVSELRHRSIIVIQHSPPGARDDVHVLAEHVCGQPPLPHQPIPAAPAVKEKTDECPY